LLSKERKNCLCTAMLFDPTQPKNNSPLWEPAAGKVYRIPSFIKRWRRAGLFRRVGNKLKSINNIEKAKIN
jgi:hypothetical protein